MQVSPSSKYLISIALIRAGQTELLPQQLCNWKLGVQPWSVSLVVLQLLTSPFYTCDGDIKNKTIVLMVRENVAILIRLSSCGMSIYFSVYIFKLMYPCRSVILILILCPDRYEAPN